MSTVRKVQYLNFVRYNLILIIYFSIKCILFQLLQRLQHLFLQFFFVVDNDVIICVSFIDCRLLWEFIYQLLQNPCYKEYVCWEKLDDYVFRINNPTGLAQLWGHQKNRTNMTYEKLSRALRYYYRMNIIKKVSGKRLTYKSV